MTKGHDYRSRLAQSLIAPLAVLLLWTCGGYLQWWPESIIASPSAVAGALYRLGVSGDLLRHSAVSLERLLLGAGVGISAGICLASLVALMPAAARIVRPLLDFIAPIPVLAWIPLFIIIFGIEGARIALIGAGTGLILYSSTLTVISDTRAEFIDLARMYRKSRIQVLTQVSLPSGAWTLFGALRMALGLSWVLLLASELIASSSGLGWLIWDSRNFSRSDEMLAAMIWVGFVGFVFDRFVAAAQNRATAWRLTFQGL
jgi:sulfonate transport system permease protein